MVITLNLNGQVSEVEDVNSLKGALLNAMRQGDLEVWIEGVDERKICALYNSSKVFFMALDNETSYTCLNEGEDLSGYEEFKLANGQVDEYPTNSTFNPSFLTKVFEHYYNNNGEFYPSMNWVRVT